MKNIGKFIISGLVIISVVFATQSCRDHDFIYDGPLVVEFSNMAHGLTTGYTWVGTGSFWSGEIRGTHADTAIQVQLVGPHQKQDLTLSWRVVDSVYRDVSQNVLLLEPPTLNAAGKPAVRNIDFFALASTAKTMFNPPPYTILNNGTITIPAGSSFGKLRFSTAPTETTVRFMYILLEEGTVKPSPNYRIFRLGIRT